MIAVMFQTVMDFGSALSSSAVSAILDTLTRDEVTSSFLFDVSTDSSDAQGSVRSDLGSVWSAHGDSQLPSSLCPVAESKPGAGASLHLSWWLSHHHLDSVVRVEVVGGRHTSVGEVRGVFEPDCPACSDVFSALDCQVAPVCGHRWVISC